jgi:hypothetical protein
MVNGMALFVKALIGGLAAAVIVWIAILRFNIWRLSVERKKLGFDGLNAVAGSWTYLLHSPFVSVGVAVGFGLGFYLTVRLLNSGHG